MPVGNWELGVKGFFFSPLLHTLTFPIQPENPCTPPEAVLAEGEIKNSRA